MTTDDDLISLRSIRLQRIQDDFVKTLRKDGYLVTGSMLTDDGGELDWSDPPQVTSPKYYWRRWGQTADGRIFQIGLVWSKMVVDLARIDITRFEIEKARAELISTIATQPVEKGK